MWYLWCALVAYFLVLIAVPSLGMRFRPVLQTLGTAVIFALLWPIMAIAFIMLAASWGNTPSERPIDPTIGNKQ
jgi:hypothetical protein